MDERALIRAIEAITERGNSAEVKKKINGDYVVYEVKKKIVPARD